MKEEVSYLKIASALLVSYIYFILTDYTLVLGFLIVPFVIYLLLDIKLKSDRIFYITVFVIWVPTLFVFSILSFITFIVIVCSVMLLEASLKQRLTQEVTMTYLTFLMGILTLGSIIILQAFQIIPSFNEITNRVIEFYEKQITDITTITGQQIDIDVMVQSIRDFFILIPSQFFIASFVIAIYTILMIRLLTKDKSELWTYIPFYKWQFPRRIAYLYFIVMILTLLQDTFSPEIYAVVVNTMLLLEWIIYIHGIAFIIYFLMKKKVSTVWIVVVTTLSVLLKPVTLFVGFIDMLFRFRQRLDMGGK